MNAQPINTQQVQERFFEALISGDRPRARQVVESVLESGWNAQDLITELYWPTYENLGRMHRADQLTTLAHHMATRLLRMLVDQNASRLASYPRNGRTILCCCGASDADELGAQMAVDLLESHGFSVTFAGGGVANDEVLAQVQERKPSVLLMFASAPSDLPNIRSLIDTIREIGACNDVQFAVGAGVFNRADGLAEEIGADVWGTDPLDMADRLLAEPARRAASDQRTVGKNRKIRKAA